MSKNYNFTSKQYEVNPRYSQKPNDSLPIKPKARDSLPPNLCQQQLNNSLESIKTTKQSSSIQNGPQFLNYKNCGQKAELSSQRNNLSQYNNPFQTFEKLKNQSDYQFYIPKNNNNQIQSNKFFQPITLKNDVNHYNSAKYINNNKIDFTPLNLDHKLLPTSNSSPNNIQLNRHQRKKSNRLEDFQHNQQTTTELLSDIKKYSQISAEAQNCFIQKTFFEKQEKQNQIQTLHKKMPRYSEPGIFFLPTDNELKTNDDIVSEFRSPHNNQNRTKISYTNPNQVSKFNYYTNQQKKFPQKQIANSEAFKKQKELKQTISTQTTQNPNKPKLRSQKSYIFQNHQQNPKLADFIKGKELGSGKFGTVNVVIHKKTGFVCAMKTIPKIMIKEQNIINQFIRELKIQSCLDHPNITKLYGFFDDKGHIYLLLELGSEGQLYKVLKEKKRFSENMVIFITRQLCDALKYLHSLNIIHRDIKPQNIVLQYGIIKLCDFGWAVIKGSELRSTFCGTPLYVSPQILQGQLYDQKIDLWSVGILTYQLLVGEIPFTITTQQQLIKIIKQDIVFPNNLNISNQAKDFVLKILKKNPDERLKIGKLLEHPFLQRNIQGSQMKL